MSVFSNRSADPPQERARYAGAILDLLGNKEPLTVLRHTPSAVAEAIVGLTPTQLRTPEGPDKWSVVQVLQHLADSDLVWGWRVRLILAMSGLRSLVTTRTSGPNGFITQTPIRVKHWRRSTSFAGKT